MPGCMCLGLLARFQVGTTLCEPHARQLPGMSKYSCPTAILALMPAISANEQEYLLIPTPTPACCDPSLIGGSGSLALRGTQVGPGSLIRSPGRKAAVAE